MSALSAWWDGLQSRERWLLGIGGAALGATLYFLAVVEPLALRESRLAKTLAAEQETRQWLASQRPLLGQGGGAPARERLPDGASLLAAINQSAAANEVDTQLTRVTPAGERGATLGFSGVPYASFMRWLLAIDAQYGASVERIRMERADAPGVVNVELSLQF